MYKRIQVIANPAAGQPEPVLQPLNAVFQEHGAEWDINVTQKAGDATRFAQEAVERGVDLIAAYGGDGTIMEVASGLVGKQTPMMILPGGTNNVLAAEFQIPQSLPQAAAQIFDRIPCPVDLGKIRDRYFMLRAEIGLIAEMNTETTRELKDQMGRFAYPVGMIRALTKAQRVQYKMTIDGQTVELEGIDCFVVNASRIHSIMGATFADGVSSTDGMLDVFISNSNVNTALLAVSRILQLEENWGVDHWQGRNITIETAVPRKVWCDGEDFGDTPVTVTVEPGAVNVLCLPPADSAPDNADPEAKEEIPAPPDGKPMNQ